MKVINLVSIIYLLAYPALLMASVQLMFCAMGYWVFHKVHLQGFLLPGSVGLVISLLIIFAGNRQIHKSKINFRDALLFAFLTWLLMGILGALPVYMITKASFIDCVFESVSGLTTTGASVLNDLEAMNQNFLLYRQFLQWIGGLGIVIFVVAVLPMLNIGGMRLLKAETPGPIKEDKISPRIAGTAHSLWIVYLALTFMCAAGYYLGGMRIYDAFAHSFTTVSTGGFSPYSASMGHFNDPWIYVIADVFMVLGAINFALHFRAWRSFNLFKYWHDEETRVFLLIILFLTCIITMILLEKSVYDQTLIAFNDALFQLISFITSTGYGGPEYTQWPYEVTLILVIAGYLGGCAGSTAGGNKIIRNVLSLKLLYTEIRRIIHPNGVFCVRFQNAPLENPVLTATIAFMWVTAGISMALVLLLMATGLDFWTALTAVGACVNVLGPGFGEVSNGFESVNAFGTVLLTFAMLLGRLEYFTVLAIFMPMFWR